MINDMKDSNVEVSIIIVNYNADEMLRDCLFTLAKYTKQVSYEIIVVDNCSTQGSVDDVISEFNGIKLIKADRNLGFGAANNFGIKIAQGEYLLFLNNDTVFIENAISKVLNFSKSLTEKTFIGCKLLNKDLSYQPSVVSFDNLLNVLGENLFLYRLFPNSSKLNKYYLDTKLPMKPVEVDVIKGAFMFCSAHSIATLNGFDARFFFYAEETDLCYRFKKEGGKVIYFPETKIIHLGGSTSFRNLWFKFKNQSIAKIQFYQKHFKGVRFFLFIALQYLGLFIRIPIYFIIGIIKFDKFNISKSLNYLKCLFVYPKNKFKFPQSIDL